jgi:hypothetical protein
MGELPQFHTASVYVAGEVQPLPHAGEEPQYNYFGIPNSYTLTCSPNQNRLCFMLKQGGFRVASVMADAKLCRNRVQIRCSTEAPITLQYMQPLGTWCYACTTERQPCSCLGTVLCYCSDAALLTVFFISRSFGLYVLATRAFNGLFDP